MTAAISIVETPGPRLIDGSDINTIIAVVNGLAAGTGSGTYTGTFNGIVGGTTPADGTFTALISTTFAPTDDITIASGKAIKTDTTTAHTAIFQAYDVDGTAYKTFATLTNGNTPSFAIAAPSGGTVSIDGAVIGGVTPAAASFTTVGASGALTFSTASSGVVLKQGANGKCGTVVLTAGAATVSNTSIALTDTVVLSLNTVGGTIAGQPYVATITASTGFTIDGGGGSNTSTYNYVIISNAA